MTKNLKTREEVLAEFKTAGISISAWARANNFHRMTVVNVLRGTSQGLWGECHRCAVALGLKDGVMVKLSSFKPAAQRRAKTQQTGVTA